MATVLVAYISNEREGRGEGRARIVGWRLFLPPSLAPWLFLASATGLPSRELFSSDIIMAFCLIDQHGVL